MEDTFDPRVLELPADIVSDIGQVPAGNQKGKKPRRVEPFLQIPHTAIVAGSKVLGGRRFLVWLYVHHRVWSDKANTVLIGNKTLSTWGVSRKVKYTALRRLAEAGLIAVQWRVRRSPIVTLLLK